VITASKFAVLRTTWANFAGAIRCDDAGRVRVAVATEFIVILQGLVRPDCIPEAPDGLDGGGMYDPRVADLKREPVSRDGDRHY
jgi:hypothetical protein